MFWEGGMGEAALVPGSKDPSEVRLARLAAICADPGTPEVLFGRLADGESLREIARAWDVPPGRLLNWLMDDEKRYAIYRRALEVHAHGLVAETLDIADGANPSSVSVAKLRVDTRFRIAKSHAPAIYGDKGPGGGGTRVTVVVNRMDGDGIPVLEGESHAIEDI